MKRIGLSFAVLASIVLALSMGAPRANAKKDVGFKAPAYNGTANASSPELGAIILDTSSGIFYGNAAVPGSSPYPNWNSFAAGGSLPSGSIIAFGGASAPSGFLICDGSAVSRSTYSALFTAIGTAYGAGDGSTTFNLPDMRGKFVRGEDNGAGNDPDASTRSACNSGGNSGDAVGTCQADQVGPHTHQIAGHCSGFTGSSAIFMNDGSGLDNCPINSSSNGTTETRALNVSVNYVIKI